MTLGERLVASFGGIALFLLAGNGVLCLFPALRARPFLVRGGYAWILGVGTAAGAVFALDHVLWIPLSRASILPVFLLLAATAPIARFLAQTTRPRAEASRRPLTLRMAVAAACLVAAAITLGLLAESVANNVRDWDGQMTWVAKARWIRAEHTVDASVLREERWFVDHPQYPPLLPLMQVMTQEVFGTDDDSRVVRPLYALFFPAFLLVLYDAAARRAGRLAAALSALMAALLPLLAFGYSGASANTTLSDFPLAAFFGAGLCLLLEASVAPSTGVAAGLLLGAAAMAKNEGMPLSITAVLIGAGVLLLRTRRRRRPILRSLLPAAFAALGVGAAHALLASWRAGIVNRFDEMYLDRLRTLPLVSETLAALPLLFRPISKEMLDPEAWANFWWCAPILFLAGASALRRRPARPLLLAIAMGLSFYLVAYAIYAGGDVDLIHPTWNRFLQQLSLPLFVLLAMCLQACLRAVRRLPARGGALPTPP